jgi:hypothetical protein
MVTNVLIPEDYNNRLEDTSGDALTATSGKKIPPDSEGAYRILTQSMTRLIESRGTLILSARRNRTRRWDSSWKGKGTSC